MTDTHPLPGLDVSFPISDALARLRDVITDVGGRPIIVGGAVRDHLLGIESKDIDVEVFGIDPLGSRITAVSPS